MFTNRLCYDDGVVTDPIIIIVDDQDNVVSYKRRSQADPNGDFYRVSALWLRNPTGQILMAQRKLSKKNDPGVWGPAAAGSVEKGETYEENIYKEAAEEIGLIGIKFALGPKQRVLDPRRFFIQWFTGVIDRAASEFVIQEEEVERVTWIDPATLKSESVSQPEKYIPYLEKVLHLLEP